MQHRIVARGSPRILTSPSQTACPGVSIAGRNEPKLGAAQRRDPIRNRLRLDRSGASAGWWERCRPSAACVARRHTEAPAEGVAEMRLAGEAVVEGDLREGAPAGKV